MSQKSTAVTIVIIHVTMFSTSLASELKTKHFFRIMHKNDLANHNALTCWYLRNISVIQCAKRCNYTVHVHSLSIFALYSVVYDNPALIRTWCIDGLAVSAIWTPDPDTDGTLSVFRLTLIPTWISNHIAKTWAEITNIHFQTSTASLLNFGNI